MNPLTNTTLQSSVAQEISLGHSYRAARLKSSQALHAWLDTFRLMLEQLKLRIATHRNHTRSLRELNSLDDRTLRELGIWRNDFKSIAKGTFAADESRRGRKKLC